MPSKIRRHAALFAVLPLLSACGIGQTLGLTGGSNNSLGQTAPAATIFGYAVADEPQAAEIARQILNQGGNAADAAAAAGFALAVTLPSRAGLGGGGACVIAMPNTPTTVLEFPPGAPSQAGGSRPAAIPTLGRGLLAIQAKYGQLPYASTIVPAERLAGGVQVSQALATDLAVVGPALLSDPAAAAIFGQNGATLTAGQNLQQPDLATTLETLRTQGVPGLYNGQTATSFAAAANAAGANLSLADLQSAVPQFTQPTTSAINSFTVNAIPTQPPTAAILPATAAFATLDKNGGAVACATTMNNLFGTGRIAAGTGILLAASPRNTPTPQLAAAIATSGNSFRAAVTGTGQQAAALAATEAMSEILARQPPATPDPGRANIITCPGLIPGGEASCSAQADPHGAGFALGSR